MAAPSAGTVFIPVRPDMTGFNATVAASVRSSSTKSQFAQLGKGMGGALLGGFAAVAIGGKIIDFIGETIDAASDQVESQNKVNVVFEDSADIITEWSKTSAEAMGISQQAALEAAGTFGNLFDAMGVVDSEGAQMSMTLVQLASDLASFNNREPVEVLEDLQSGLTGQIRPLRKYGIEISEASLKQEAMAQGITKSTQEMTLAEKVALRYTIILKQTGNAQGDFARTSDEVANAQRILAAQMDDLKSDIGLELLPVVKELLPVLRDFATTVLPLIGKGFVLAAEAAGPFIDTLEAINTLTDPEASFLSSGKYAASLDLTARALSGFSGPGSQWLGILKEGLDQTRILTKEEAQLRGQVHGTAEAFLNELLPKLELAAGGHEAAADAAREQRRAELELVDTFFAQSEALRRRNEAQQTLDKLLDKGKTGKQVREAELDLLDAQLELEASTRDLEAEMDATGKTAEDITTSIEILGRRAGIGADDIDELTAALIRLNNTPGGSRVVAGLLNGTGTGFPTPPDNRRDTAAHGGRVVRSGEVLVGERGPEIVRLPTGADVVPNHRLGADMNGLAAAVAAGVRAGLASIEVRLERDRIGKVVERELTARITQEAFH